MLSLAGRQEIQQSRQRIGKEHGQDILSYVGVYVCVCVDGGRMSEWGGDAAADEFFPLSRGT